MTRSAADVLRAFGGTAAAADILSFTTQWSLRAALAKGDVQRLTRGVYALPQAPAADKLAKQMRGILSHESAAAHWLMDALCPPAAVHVTLGRNSRRDAPRGVVLHYAQTTDDEVTDPLRTVLDCARTLPFHEALAIADSALRRQLVDADVLVDAAVRRTGAGRARMLRVAENADGRAENPFESSIRAILIEEGVTGFQPQLVIPGPKIMRVDLGDAVRRIVVEGDSYTHHGTRAAFARDCHRYTELVSQDWLVLRIAWEHAMFERDWVGRMVARTVSLREAASRTRRSRRKRLPASG